MILLSETADRILLSSHGYTVDLTQYITALDSLKIQKLEVIFAMLVGTES